MGREKRSRVDASPGQLAWVLGNPSGTCAAHPQCCTLVRGSEGSTPGVDASLGRLLWLVSGAPAVLPTRSRVERSTTGSAHVVGSSPGSCAALPGHRYLACGGAHSFVGQRTTVAVSPARSWAVGSNGRSTEVVGGPSGSWPGPVVQCCPLASWVDRS